MPAQTPTVCAECGAALRGATIDSLISALERITGELEKHTAAMNYAGTEEFNVHTFSGHPFGEHSYDALHDLNRRIERVRNDLCSVEDERHDYAALTLGQQKSRTTEFEQLAQDAQSSAEQPADTKPGSTSRATAWAALPPEEAASDR
jgi:hypothetical protein